MRKLAVQNLEDQLAEVKSKVGILNIDEAMKAITASEAKLREENNVALAEMDEAAARANMISNLLAKTLAERATASSTGASTNAGATNKLVPPTEAEKEAYIKARQRLADLQILGAKLQSMYTTNSLQVKVNLSDIEDAEAKKKALEDANPALLVVAAAETRTPGSPAPPAGPDPVAAFTSAYNNELAHMAGIQARIHRQTNDLVRLRDDGTNLVALELTIHRMERELQFDQAEWNQMQSAMNLAAISEQAGPNKDSSITITEQPTPPLAESKKLKTIVAGIAGGGWPWAWLWPTCWK